MKLQHFIPLFLAPLCFAQAPWTPFLDPSRAIDWSTGAGANILAYSVPCSTQPTLGTGSGNAAANRTSIQNASNSCDATHNVVTLPAGTYYVNGFAFGTQGNQVLRGAGPKSTYLYIMSANSPTCAGLGGGICMMDSRHDYGGGAANIPPSGTTQCAWTGGYTKGTTSITLSTCPGGAPPVGQTMILDQANDTSITSALLNCSGPTMNCSIQNGSNGEGRFIGGVSYSQAQTVKVISESGSGTGPFTVVISPGVYFNNIRSGQSPGAWWPGFVQNDGIENMTLDYSLSSAGATGIGAVLMYDCYNCWMKNIRSIDPGRDNLYMYQSLNDTVRDSYFYQAQGHASVSYAMEMSATSAFLIENNIMQQTTVPVIQQSGTGGVIDYNFGVDDIFVSPYMNGAYTSHNSGNNMNLWEGNNFVGLWADIIWGSSNTETFYRNFAVGWQSGLTRSTQPIIIEALDRAFNVVGNVLGQPGYHTQYEGYATSTTTYSGAANQYFSIYDIGAGGTGDVCGFVSGSSILCDPGAYTTLMRWGNYDTVNAATRWNSTEAAPGAITYVSANFTTSYFDSLAHTLPPSLYYDSTPSWWPSGKNWPPIGPDVATGNIGKCSGGTYDKVQAIASGQCTGGTFASAWASHATSIPAQDCFLNVMGGPPDGSGSVLNFDANTCYPAANSAPGTPFLILGP